jgi:hypothetical protein
MMQRLRRRLSIFVLPFAIAVGCAFAQATLTQIQDTVYTPSGDLFSGTVIVTWTGPLTPTGNNPAPSNTSVKIYNGVLSVSLVPSVTASPTAYYQAVYNSSNGLITWTETWQVPASSTPVKLSQVRVPNPAGSGGTGGSGGSGSGTPVTIAQVSGLNDYLNALNGSLTTLTSLVNGLNATITGTNTSLASLTDQVNAMRSGTTNALFSDGETPTGVINGTNRSFTLSSTPASAGSLALYRNGILMISGLDYTLSGSTALFSTNQIPQAADTLQAYYRIPGTGSASTFVDNETPQGAADGTNLIFNLSASPNPVLSLKLFKNGDLLQQNIDYTLSGSIITFATQAVTPRPGDSLTASYRTTTQ